MAGGHKRIEHDDVVGWFAGRLREVRASRGMTQAELAARAGVSAAYVGRLELGQAAPGIDLVAKLAKALGTPAAGLMPDGPAGDGTVVLRARARQLFDRVAASDDEPTLSLLAQLLAKLAETAPPAR